MITNNADCSSLKYTLKYKPELKKVGLGVSLARVSCLIVWYVFYSRYCVHCVRSVLCRRIVHWNGNFLSLSLYPWHLERWAEGEIEISLQSKLKLKFELEPYEGTYCRENSTCTPCLSQAFYACLIYQSLLGKLVSVQ